MILTLDRKSKDSKTGGMQDPRPIKVKSCWNHHSRMLAKAGVEAGVKAKGDPKGLAAGKDEAKVKRPRLQENLQRVQPKPKPSLCLQTKP